MKWKFLHYFLVLFCLFGIQNIAAHGFDSELESNVERIKNFESDITVHEDGSLTVIETITVFAYGNQIQHGIYRDFPTLYRDDYWLSYKVPFDVTRVLLDGEPEHYFFDSLATGKRVYIGNENILIAPG